MRLSCLIPALTLWDGFYEDKPHFSRSRGTESDVLVTQSCLFATPWTVAGHRLLCPWNSPGKNTGVGCHAFLQGILPTPGSNLGLLLCGLILYRLSRQGSP